jgi:competence protein CoiA
VIKLYTALLNDQLVLASRQAALINKTNSILKAQHYYCPKCHEEVQLVLKKEHPYFKHWPKKNNMKGERIEHALSKQLLQCALANANLDAQIEVPLAGGKLRADVLASPKLAFEVQCAPLSRAEFIQRHRLYCQIGITDIWVVGKRHFLREKIKKSQLIFFRRNKSWHDYYLEIDPYQQFLSLKYNILLEPITEKLCYQTSVFDLNANGLKQLWHFRPLLRNYLIDPISQKSYLQLQIMRKSRKGMRIAELLYKLNLKLTDLPEWVFTNYRRVNTIDNALLYLTSNEDGW